MPFDATAWLSNNAAMRLSFACKGLWLDMLCCMWVSIERGVMMKPIGGAYTVDELEALYGSGTKELIESLINAELLSVRNDGALYNTDMVKMESIRVKRSEAGKKGGVTMGKRILAKVDALVETPPTEMPHTPSPRDEYAKLCTEYGEEAAKAMIDILNNYKGSKGKKYKSDYLTIRGWVKDKYYENMNRYGQQTGTTAATDIGKPSAKRTFRDTL